MYHLEYYMCCLLLAYVYDQLVALNHLNLGGTIGPMPKMAWCDTIAKTGAAEACSESPVWQFRRGQLLSKVATHWTKCCKIFIIQLVQTGNTQKYTVLKYIVIHGAPSGLIHSLFLDSDKLS